MAEQECDHSDSQQLAQAIEQRRIIRRGIDLCLIRKDDQFTIGRKYDDFVQQQNFAGEAPPVSVAYIKAECEAKRADQDCPAGRPSCDGLTGRCVGCLSDVGCAGVEDCRFLSCREARPCALDGDCPGERICREGRCVPSAACEGDRFDALPAPVTLNAPPL
jgi:hypothetical protein